MSSISQEQLDHLNLFAFVSMLEATTYCISQIRASEKRGKKMVSHRPKQQMSRIEKSAISFLNDFSKRTNEEEEDFLTDQSSLLFEFAQVISFVPNESIEAFSTDLFALIRQYNLNSKPVTKEV